MLELWHEKRNGSKAGQAATISNCTTTQASGMCDRIASYRSIVVAPHRTLSKFERAVIAMGQRFTSKKEVINHG
jgi:hypothetical protein